MSKVGTKKEEQPSKQKICHCSFCGTSSEKAYRLIAGPKKVLSAMNVSEFAQKF